MKALTFSHREPLFLFLVLLRPYSSTTALPVEVRQCGEDNVRRQSSPRKAIQLTLDSVPMLEMTVVAKYKLHCPENIIFFVSEALRLKHFKMLEPLCVCELRERGGHSSHLVCN